MQQNYNSFSFRQNDKEKLRKSLQRHHFQFSIFLATFTPFINY